MIQMCTPVRFFFFNDTATTEIYTLSLHDALPISTPSDIGFWRWAPRPCPSRAPRSEEHTSELQSPCNLVCRLLLEKKAEEGGLVLGIFGLGCPELRIGRTTWAAFGYDSESQCRKTQSQGSA